MHELSLCRGLIQLLQEQAQQQDFRRVTAVWLEVGPLAAVEPAAMAFGFRAASLGTLAQGARLHLVPCPARARCRACGHCMEIQSWEMVCSECGSTRLQILSGQTLTIRELEVE
ncbi:hydrogenase maturation nickel metallochaperone HypA [Marinobacterium weihaiense]|uniref:Hydrogenase maturation factor HypA n=1 Tax=Marinobacterium weihaiense TaxID=2851016 RepID=A0ABS6M6J5_9GAMM|nr:hydrogenase maturation nickel metallochaperone HypA [Marinobacterium weihaiense]MBV0931896.1 hydrogenase maturation nickel metallochaperone HypA [Marinobacterium weihaiense]